MNVDVVNNSKSDIHVYINCVADKFASSIPLEEVVNGNLIIVGANSNADQIICTTPPLILVEIWPVNTVNSPDSWAIFDNNIAVKSVYKSYNIAVEKNVNGYKMTITDSKSIIKKVLMWMLIIIVLVLLIGLGIYFIRVRKNATPVLNNQKINKQQTNQTTFKQQTNQITIKPQSNNMSYVG